jgi:signal transduction histidine kinase
MRLVLARFHRWADAPQVYELTALVATALLVLVELLTPLDVRSKGIGPSTILVSPTPHAWALELLARAAGLLLVLAPLAALRSVALGVLLVLPRLLVGAAFDFAWPWTAYAALVAVAVCASWRRPLVAWLVAAVATALPVAVIADRGRMMTPGGSVEFGPPLVHTSTRGLVLTIGLYFVYTAVVMLVTLLLRREAARQRDVFDLVRRRREVTRDAATLDERSRLARDLHDVVAHHVSLIAVRAETAPYTCPDLSVDARLVLSEIAADSRQALDELRGVLGVLRRGDGDRDRSPQPTAAAISTLVLQAQSATHVVSASLQGLDGVQATPGYVAYRVVQEALTNARRHAPGVPVDVIAHGDGTGGIRVLVTNKAAAQSSIERGGGLTGMAERVVAVGGELEVELRGGEFVVEARLPAVPGAST